MARWSPRDDERLNQFWLQGLSSDEIGKRIGRSKGSVIGRANRLGLPCHELASRPYTDLDNERLILLRRAGVTFKEVAFRLNRNVSSLQKHYKKLRLAGAVPEDVHEGV